MTQPLPKLLDAASLSREMGLPRRATEAIMRQLPKQRIPGFRKVYVRRSDVQRLLDESVDESVARRPLRRVA